MLIAGRAELAGVLKKDRLLKVNGKGVTAKTITDVLANPSTYPATVTVRRVGVDVELLCCISSHECLSFST